MAFIYLFFLLMLIIFVLSRVPLLIMGHKNTTFTVSIETPMYVKQGGLHHLKVGHENHCLHPSRLVTLLKEREPNYAYFLIYR